MNFQAQVKGFSKAKFKKFTSLAAAESFVHNLLSNSDAPSTSTVNDVRPHFHPYAKKLAIFTFIGCERNPIRMCMLSNLVLTQCIYFVESIEDPDDGNKIGTVREINFSLWYCLDLFPTLPVLLV